MFRFLIVAFYIIILFSGCGQKEKKKVQAPLGPHIDSLKIEYATGFKVTYSQGAKWVEVPRPYQGAKEGFKYLLIEKGQEVPPHDDNTQVIEVPVQNIVCTSTTHIPLLNYIGETDALVGFPTTDYISSEMMRKRVDAGAVTDLGVDNEMNLELLIGLDPDMVMAYSLSGDLGQFNQIQNADIPVVINAEYLESHPLGRAEWIKFMALFFNKENKAYSVFSAIEKQYFELKSQVDTIENKPTVLSGIVYGDTWYMPGGDNYAAKLINDAGGNYIWSDNNERGFLELSFESVFDIAQNADYWIGVGNYESMNAMQNSDNRYTEFKAFQNNKVYTYNARQGAKGGSEFLELGYLRPDLILSDLVKIMHPEMMKDYELYFHANLPQSAQRPTEKK